MSFGAVANDKDGLLACDPFRTIFTALVLSKPILVIDQPYGRIRQNARAYVLKPQCDHTHLRQDGDRLNNAVRIPSLCLGRGLF